MKGCVFERSLYTQHNEWPKRQRHVHYGRGYMSKPETESVQHTLRFDSDDIACWVCEVKECVLPAVFVSLAFSTQQHISFLIN